MRLQNLSKIASQFAGMKPAALSQIKQRIKLWLLLIFLVLGTSFFTRLILLIVSFDQIDAGNIIGILLIGLLYDLVNAIYIGLPFVLYLWLLPDRMFNKQWHWYVILIWFFIFSTGLIFNGVAEYLFWDEFGARFNFIAVDYLVYTSEVVGNITQSYPIVWIVTAIVISSVGLVAFIALKINWRSDRFPFFQRTKFAAIYAVIFTFCYFVVSQDWRQFSNNAYSNELAGNGLYELFAAYLHNELDYDRFYEGLAEKEANDMVHNLVNTPEVKWSATNEGIERTISNPGPEKKLNVVLISVESLSAHFMERFGNHKGITPFLDSLSNHSLIFTNLYATGTRTVRGLEALSLCVPPTPGQSIVRRPNNEHLFSMGKVFHDKGYTCEYIYGGYGYFDNMNYFFGNNDYQVVDRTSLNDNDIHYENVWGVADEDLFTLAERQLDEASKTGPVFTHIMTTSNHRPFTYPEGRIDIPSHTGRNGAVKYTDFAIGKFIKLSSEKEWFQNTIFIIVADHCASSAGKTELPVDKYHIPMLVYSPKHIQPGVMDRLMSQIDIGPTLLGMMNFSYDSKFFGYDIFKLQPGRERAFISTYQSLGYIKGHKLVILTPQKRVVEYELSDDMKPIKEIVDNELKREAIAWYQVASNSFKKGTMRLGQLQSLK